MRIRLSSRRFTIARPVSSQFRKMVATAPDGTDSLTCPSLRDEVSRRPSPQRPFGEGAQYRWGEGGHAAHKSTKPDSLGPVPSAVALRLRSPVGRVSHRTSHDEYTQSTDICQEVRGTEPKRGCSTTGVPSISPHPPDSGDGITLRNDTSVTTVSRGESRSLGWS